MFRYRIFPNHLALQRSQCFFCAYLKTLIPKHLFSVKYGYRSRQFRVSIEIQTYLVDAIDSWTDNDRPIGALKRSCPRGKLKVVGLHPG